MTTNGEYQYSDETFRSPLTVEQNKYLLSPVDPNRVGKSNGQSNMEAYDIRAHLNRVFGFGNWDGEADTMELVGERWGKNKKGGEAVTVVYRCRYTLRVRTTDGRHLATYTEWAMGDAINFPEFKYGDAHDFAAKTAESQALKRCAINLGDQFGLSLYRKGSLAPVVNWSLAKAADLRDAQPAAQEDRSVPDVVPEEDPDTPNHGEAGQEAQAPAPARSQPQARQFGIGNNVKAQPANDANTARSAQVQWEEIGAWLDEMGKTDGPAKKAYVQQWLSTQPTARTVQSVADLTFAEAAALIAHLGDASREAPEAA